MTEKEKNSIEKKRKELLKLFENDEYSEVDLAESCSEQDINDIKEKRNHAKSLTALALVLTIILGIIVGWFAGKNNSKNNKVTTSINATTDNHDDNVISDELTEEEITEMANTVYNAYDKTNITFSIQSVIDTIKFLNGIATKNYYTDIEILEIIDNVIYNGMDSKVVPLVGAISNNGPVNKNINIVPMKNFFKEGTSGNLLVKKFDSLLNRLIANQDNQEELVIIAKEVLRLEAELLYSKTMVNGINYNITDLPQGVQYMLFSYMNQMYPIIATIDQDLSVVINIAKDTNDIELERINVNTIGDRINKTDCQVLGHPMTQQNAAMIALLNQQKLEHEQNKLTLN